MTTLQLGDGLRAFLEKSTERYQESLWKEEGEDALHYLEVERGLSQDTILRFRLGYVSEPLPGHEHVSERIAIPYLTPDGSTVDMKFRKLSDEQSGPKYLKLSGGTQKIYNTSALERGTSGLIICEGEIDAITAEQCGFPAIGIPGANSWNPLWARLLVQYSVVYMLADGDEAGKGLYREISQSLDNVRLIPFGEKEDVNSFVKENGADGLRRKLNI